jgi:hypothetical protein
MGAGGRGGGVVCRVRPSPYVPRHDQLHVRVVCRDWRRWLDEARIADEAARTPLTDDQMGVVIGRLRALHLPWSAATDSYVRRHLSSVPCAAADGSDVDALAEYLARLYHRAVVAPKTNIGTPNRGPSGGPGLRALDTTRVIERLTQARLSRFHTTGATRAAARPTTGGAAARRPRRCSSH